MQLFAKSGFFHSYRDLLFLRLPGEAAPSVDEILSKGTESELPNQRLMREAYGRHNKITARSTSASRSCATRPLAKWDRTHGRCSRGSRRHWSCVKGIHPHRTGQSDRIGTSCSE